jgi:hypothetical protein
VVWSRRRLPAWLHQAVAYLAGAVIVGFAVHAPSADGPVLLAGAGLVVALALLTRGPLGPLQLLGSRTLRLAEVVVAAALAVLPFFQSGGPRLEVVVTLWLAAVALVRLAVLPVAGRETASPPPTAGPVTAKSPTAKAPPAKSPTAKSPTAKSPTAKSPTAKSPTAKSPTAAPATSTPSVLDAAVRQAGRRTGQAGRQVRRVTQQAQPAMLRGARALGRVAGRRQAGRRGDDTA